MLNTGFAGMFRGRVGALDYVIVTDGTLDVGLRRDVLRPQSARYVASAASDARLELSQNVLALDGPEGWLVFETGASSSEHHPNAGQLMANLAAAGINRNSVASLIPTHAHLDHAGGIMGADGTRNYPNATINLAGIELDFWLHDDRLDGPSARSAVIARRNLLPNMDRTLRHSGVREILPGVHAMAASGHTIGHAGYLIADGRQSLFIAGDLAHDLVQIENPDVATAFDYDAAMAVATRRRILAFLAANRILTLFYHFAWPGLGFIEPWHEGFRFLPVGNETGTSLF